MAQKKEKNKLLALLYTIGVHAVILVLMLFVVAWRLPNPPLPESGAMINLGFDDQGSGDIQPEEPVGSEKKHEDKTEESKPEEKVAEEPKEEKQTAKPVVDKTTDEELLTSKEESPMVVKEKKEEKPKEEPKKEIKKEEPKEEPKKENPIAVYKPTKTDASGTTSDGREGKPGNQGDDKGKVGDKGNPNGVVGSDIYTGKPGGGGGGNGPALDLYGWDWDEIPKPQVVDNETGRIVFLIQVNENGEIEGYQKESSSVSLATERACAAAIQKLTFTKKSGVRVPPISNGKITFVIKAK